MSQLHFSMVFSGTVSPNGNDPEANDIAMTRDDLNANLEQAIANITGNGWGFHAHLDTQSTNTWTAIPR